MGIRRSHEIRIPIPVKKNQYHGISGISAKRFCFRCSHVVFFPKSIDTWCPYCERSWSDHWTDPRETPGRHHPRYLRVESRSIINWSSHLFRGAWFRTLRRIMICFAVKPLSRSNICKFEFIIGWELMNLWCEPWAKVLACWIMLVAKSDIDLIAPVTEKCP